jgi:phosphohistidine phosphatase
MKIYLVRHAIAEAHGAPPDPARAAAKKSKPFAVDSDSDRALTEQGKSKMARAAQGLRKIKIGLDLVLTSPLRRARETAEIVAGELGGVKIETLDALAPGAEPSAIVTALRRLQNLQAVALVGHEPDLGHLASFLLAGSPNACHVNFKKGAVACLEGDFADGASSCSLLWLMPPKLLRAI